MVPSFVLRAYVRYWVKAALPLPTITVNTGLIRTNLNIRHGSVYFTYLPALKACPKVFHSSSSCSIFSE
jgi:hypothetical protein